MREGASPHKFMHTVTIVVVIVVVYGIAFTTPMLRHIANGVDTMQKLLTVQDSGVVLSNSPLNDDYIEPIWSCRDTDREKKLVFVHVFKTAGSSMRALLTAYAEKCHAGYVTVINCGAVKVDSLRAGNNWEKDEEFRRPQYGTSCKLKKTVFRNGTVVDQTRHKGPINTTYIEQAKVDIVSGHVSLGIDDQWKDDRDQHVDVQYLTFFRESKQKFVSAILYLRPNLSFEDAVEQVKQAVRKRLSQEDYLTDITNFMTPTQRDDFQERNVTLSPEDNANLIIQNLKENKNNILVGIVERMSESLEMLQHTIDKDSDLDDMFEAFGKIPPGTNKTKEYKQNKSRLSSSEVLAEVEKDEDFMKVMREFTKWDEKVYHFALDMHMRQYEAFQKRQPKEIVESVNAVKEIYPEEERVEETIGGDSRSSTMKLDEQLTEHAEGETAADSPLSSVVKLVDPTLEQAEETDGSPSSALSAGSDYSSPVIEPMWSCSDTDRKTKLAFVHIFKTAGSSMRSLLRSYAEKCNAGLAIVVNCAPVDASTLETGNWAKKNSYRSRKHGTACKLKNTVFRNNTAIKHSPGPGHDVPINTTYLEHSKIDILGGHITMGTDQYWRDDQGQHVDMHYLSFFRESTRKFVSAVLFMNPKLSFDEAVQRVKDRLNSAVAKSEYLDNSNYIITPARVSKLVNITLTPEDRANLMIETLRENKDKMLFGIVERMSESLEMVQHLVDKDGELDDVFESFGKIPPGTNKTKAIVANKSRLSSSSVLAEVEKDEETMKLMREFVKWDTKVYRFALDMHMRQYEAFQRQKSKVQTVTRIETAPQLVANVERVEETSNVDTSSRAVIEVSSKLDGYRGDIEPIWSCQDTNRSKKLVFVHLFKCGGSSMRRLLRAYAETCNAGLAVAIRCAPVLPESVESGNWVRDDKGRTPCQLTQTTYRNNTIDTRIRPMNTTVLEQSPMDILAGHITMGTEYDWKNDEGKHVDVQYLAFFRESTRKYVSSTLYLNRSRKLSLNEAVEKVKDRVKKAVARSEYLDYSHYIITPTQKANFKNITLTHEDRANLVMKNLQENNALVGIVERMSESLEMLQRVVDKDGELDSMFESYGKVPPGTNKTNEIRANQSSLSSEAVLAEVVKDEEFMKVFREFVKWDDMIYRFALGMHMRQYEAFQHQQKVIER